MALKFNTCQDISSNNIDCVNMTEKFEYSCVRIISLSLEVCNKALLADINDIITIVKNNDHDILENDIFFMSSALFLFFLNPKINDAQSQTHIYNS